MSSSNNSSTKLLSNKKIIYAVFAALSFLGFLDATYLTILHYQNVIPPCSIAHGCETVLTSKFATIGTIPIALLGSLYYFGLIMLAVSLLQKSSKLGIKLLKIKVLAGFIVSVVLVILQAFVIHAFCQYCLTSEFITTLLFLIGYTQVHEEINKIVKEKERK